MCERFYEESLPSAHGGNIAALAKGDEVLIEAGCGYPPYTEDQIDIIVAVDQFSALTAGGIRLACCDGQGVTKTGKTDLEFTLSQEAIKALQEAGITPEEI
jgi:hypothetical protein